MIPLSKFEEFLLTAPIEEINKLLYKNEKMTYIPPPPTQHALKYQYKVVSVLESYELDRLNKLLAEGWEVFNVTAHHGRGDSTLICPILYTIRKYT